ncbi:hypothetical protein VKT23_006607 [Stygiomarasmius scandens]|uniref:Uncharacterized protein n=1 Tax=Marasmiellus scandens TaxID=2682957 RepID=A0ABR1JN80_9AGAR
MEEHLESATWICRNRPESWSRSTEELHLRNEGMLPQPRVNFPSSGMGTLTLELFATQGDIQVLQSNEDEDTLKFDSDEYPSITFTWSFLFDLCVGDDDHFTSLQSMILAPSEETGDTTFLDSEDSPPQAHVQVEQDVESEADDDFVQCSLDTVAPSDLEENPENDDDFDLGTYQNNENGDDLSWVVDAESTANDTDVTNPSLELQLALLGNSDTESFDGSEFFSLDVQSSVGELKQANTALEDERAESDRLDTEIQKIASKKLEEIRVQTELLKEENNRKRNFIKSWEWANSMLRSDPDVTDE